jgi:hypothetical protein
MAMKILKPFKLWHYKSTESTDKKVQDNVTSVLSFAASAVTIIGCFPYDGIVDFVIVVAGSFLLAFICALLVGVAYPRVKHVLSLLLSLPAMLYDFCDDKVNNVSSKGAQSSFMRKCARPEVGIRYFITQAERREPNHATYLGPG